MAAAIWPPLRALLSHSAGLRVGVGLFPSSADFQLWGNQGCGRRVQAVATPDAALFCPKVVMSVKVKNVRETKYWRAQPHIPPTA